MADALKFVPLSDFVAPEPRDQARAPIRYRGGSFVDYPTLTMGEFVQIRSTLAAERYRTQNTRRRQPAPLVRMHTTTPRASRRESHRLASGHRRTVKVRGGDGGDDGPAPAEPPRRAVLGFALTKCPTCGAPLVWHGGNLICPTRTCTRWGKPC